MIFMPMYRTRSWRCSFGYPRILWMTYKKKMTPGNNIIISGVVSNMKTAFRKLGIGFIFAIMLVYFIMVINFQSWLDPFVIIMAIPGAFAGIIWMLFLTGTTFNIPSLMGSIMSIGVVTANSILLVTFANFQLREGKTSIQAIHTAALTRLRPILMTALAMIVGMIPMALGTWRRRRTKCSFRKSGYWWTCRGDIDDIIFCSGDVFILAHKGKPLFTC